MFLKYIGTTKKNPIEVYVSIAQRVPVISVSIRQGNERGINLTVTLSL